MIEMAWYLWVGGLFLFWLLFVRPTWYLSYDCPDTKFIIQKRTKHWVFAVPYEHWGFGLWLPSGRIICDYPSMFWRKDEMRGK